MVDTFEFGFVTPSSISNRIASLRYHVVCLFKIRQRYIEPKVFPFFTVETSEVCSVDDFRE